MNFLIVNQFFAPDPAPTGQLLADVACALAAQGHSVTVICARSPYAGAVAGNCEIPGVTVRRVRCTSFGHGAAARIGSYASFYFGALRRLLTEHRPDVLLTLTPPPLLSLGGTIAKYLRGSKHLIWEMDVYPDVAVAVATFERGSWLERTVGALADFSRQYSDAV